MSFHVTPPSPEQKQSWQWFGRMPLQYKAWTMSCLMIISVTLVMSIGVYHTFRRSFDRMERKMVEEHVDRLHRIIQNSVDNLERGTKDYANWDDTADYVVNQNRRWEDANFNASTFNSLQLYAMLVFDVKGNWVSGRYINEAGALNSADNTLWSRLFQQQVKASLLDESQGVKGFLKTPDGLCYYASMPVHRNDGVGPVAGVIIQVKRFDAQMLKQLRDLTALDLRLDPMDYATNDPVEQELNDDGKADFSCTIVDDDWIAFHAPVRNAEGNPLAHFHGRVERNLQQHGRRAQLILYTGIFSITVIAGLVMVWLLRSLVIARLEKLNAEVRRIAQEASPDARVTLTGHDEISELGKEINMMLEAMVYVEARHAEALKTSEQLETQLLQAQKMEAIGTMAGGLAHDFNNMLNSILGSADLLRYELPQKHAAQEHIRRIEKAGANATALVQQLLAVSRRQPLKPEPIRLGETVMDAMKLLQAALPKNIEFHLLPETVDDMVLADSPQIHQVIMNLATNAAHAMAGRDKARFTVTLQACRLPDSARAETSRMPPGEYLRLIIADNGAGIPQENMERIFEPFFTTKPSGSGTGLGLAVVHGIIGKHNGCISVESKLSVGTRFFIHLPKIVGQSPGATRSETLANNPAPKSHGSDAVNVLLVDDDRMVCDTLSNGLRRLGYTVYGITSTEEALRMIADPGMQISVLITDQMMPGINGMELGARVRALRPGLPMILISGYASALEEEHVLSKGFSLMLMKPLTAGQLSQAVQSALMIERGTDLKQR